MDGIHKALPRLTESELRYGASLGNGDLGSHVLMQERRWLDGAWVTWIVSWLDKDGGQRTKRFDGWREAVSFFDAKAAQLEAGRQLPLAAHPVAEPLRQPRQVEIVVDSI